jgi:acyl-CoA thioesterase-1
MRRLLAPLSILVALTASACGGSEDAATPAAAESPAAAPTAASGPRPVATAPAAAVAPAPFDPFVLVVLGDSLVSGEALPDDALLAAQLQDQLAARRLSVEVRDESAAGDAASAAARFGADPDADALVIVLGGDDLAARGSPAAVGAALARVIEAAQARGLWVGVIGLEAPLAGGQSIDRDYETAFNGLYDSLAATYRVELYPDFFAGLVDRETGETRPELFLDDGVHPTDLGTAIIADGVADWLADTLPRNAHGG